MITIVQNGHGTEKEKNSKYTMLSFLFIFWSSDISVGFKYYRVPYQINLVAKVANSMVLDSQEFRIKYFQAV